MRYIFFYIKNRIYIFINGAKKVRNFVFTINNYTDTCEIMLRSLFEEKSKYLIYGYEVGESGTKHLQGYCELKQQVSFETLKKYIPRAHIELRKGTAIQAAEYCKKDGNYKEFGELSKQGSRTDLQGIGELCREGASIKSIAELYPETFIKFHRGVKELRNILSDVRDWKTEVIWCSGKTGTGKTKIFYDNFKEDRWI